MFETGIHFGNPAWLSVLAILPIGLIAFWNQQASLQRGLANVLRCITVMLIVAALAEIQWVRNSHEIDTVFVVDQSDSMSPAIRSAAYTIPQRQHSQRPIDHLQDRTGIVVLGRSAIVDQPLADHINPTPLESDVDRTGSNLADSLRLASTLFDRPAGKRIVLITDGYSTHGDLAGELASLAQQGITLDVLLTPSSDGEDIAVRSVQSPRITKQGTPFQVTVVIERRNVPSNQPETQAGRVVVSRQTLQSSTLIADELTVLKPGANVFRFVDRIESKGFANYVVKFIPADSQPDVFLQNNTGSSVTQVETGGRVLLIADENQMDQWSNLISLLGEQKIEIELRPLSAPFAGLQDLQNFDAVILANVPRVSNSGDFAEVRFSDNQIELLHSNLQKLGCGLMMIGGPQSFGAGGWSKSKLEEAMPVDFDVKNDRLVAVGALALVIDKSGSMQGDKLSTAIAAARAAMSLLSDNDYIGVYTFDSELGYTLPLRSISDQRNVIRRAIGRIAAGGGTNMYPAISAAYRDLQKSPAALKHVIVLTDGQTDGSGYEALAAHMHQQGITTSTVSIGDNAADPLLQKMAKQGGGQFYHPRSNRIVPGIFMKEARVIRRPVVFTDDAGISLSLQPASEILSGVGDRLPMIRGFVLTTRKDNLLVEPVIVANKPEAPHNSVLTAWPYGVGRAVAWTTDAGQTWASDLAQTPEFAKLMAQTVRWIMRPPGMENPFSISTQTNSGHLQVVVNSSSDNLEPSGAGFDGELIRTDGTSIPIRFKQTSPRQFIAETDLDESGDYLVTAAPMAGSSLLRAGFSFYDTLEYQPTPNQRDLLTQAAKDLGGEWQPLSADTSGWADEIHLNPYRKMKNTERSIRDAWPLCVLIASIVFLFDVALRKIQVFDLWFSSRVQQPRPTAVPISLSTSEASLATTFPPEGSRMEDPNPRKVSQESPSETSANLYTARLLKAKKSASKNRPPN